MRIINQGRESDVNYDKCSIEYDCDDKGKHIVFADFTYGETVRTGISLGIYVSKERCLQVMESIRNSYSYGTQVYLMPEE